MNYKDISEKSIDNHIDRIIEVAESIEPNKVTILTGGNASGKSVVRKLLNVRLADKLGKESATSSVSMELRTSGNSGLLGTGLDHMYSDNPWESTGEHTVYLVKGLLKSNVSEKMAETNKRYIVIDELETGLSKEALLGMCQMLESEMERILKNSYGILLITHSDEVVRNLKHDSFINIEGLTEEEWLNREVEPVEPEDIEKWSRALYLGIRNRQKKN